MKKDNIITLKDIEEGAEIVRKNTNQMFQIRPEDAALVKHLLKNKE